MAAQMRPFDRRSRRISTVDWIRFSFSSKRANRRLGRFKPSGTTGEDTATGLWDDAARELRRARWSRPCCRVASGVRAGAAMLDRRRSPSRVLASSFLFWPLRRVAWRCSRTAYVIDVVILWARLRQTPEARGHGRSPTWPEEAKRTWNGARDVIENCGRPGSNSATSVTAGWGPSRRRGRGDPRDERRRNESVDAAAERARLTLRRPVGLVTNDAA